jgi:hypothetical protein
VVIQIMNDRECIPILLPLTMLYNVLQDKNTGSM